MPTCPDCSEKDKRIRQLEDLLARTSRSADELVRHCTKINNKVLDFQPRPKAKIVRDPDNGGLTPAA